MSDEKKSLDSLITGKVSLGTGTLFDSLLGSGAIKEESTRVVDAEDTVAEAGNDGIVDEVDTDETFDFEEAEDFDELPPVVVVEQSTDLSDGGLAASLMARYATPGAVAAPLAAPVVPTSSPSPVAIGAVRGSETPSRSDSTTSSSVEGIGALVSDSPDGVTETSKAKASIFVDDTEDFFAKPESAALSGIVTEDASAETDVDSISYEDRFRHYSDIVLGAVLHDGKEFADRRKWLYGQITPDLFMGENFLIYTALYRKREDLLNLGDEYLRMYLRDNLGIIKKAGAKLDLSTYDSIDGSQELGYIEGTIKHWSYLTSLEYVTQDEFHRAHETYVLYYKNLELARTLANGMEILQEGLKSKGKDGMQAGSADTVDYVRRSFATVEGATERKQGVGFISLKDYIENPEDSVKPFKVSDYHNITELNDHYGGIMSGQLLTFVGPSKGGKSKICARAVHTAMTKYGHNVTVWPVEGGNNLFSAQLRAIAFDEYYNDPNTVSRSDMRFGVDQETIAYGKWKEKFNNPEEMRAMELQSASDLVNNTNYGRIDLIDRDFNVDTFMEEIDTSVQGNGSSMILIDYPQLIGNGTKGSKREAISEAYIKLAAYSKKNNIAIIAPAQYSQSAIKDMSGGKGEAPDIRVAIGESSEIMRSSDIVISMYATVDELLNNRLRFQSNPSRYAQPFEEFAVNIDLGRSLFSSIVES